MFQGIRGYKICRIWTYGLGDMIFRSLNIFLNMYYGSQIRLLRVMPLLAEFPSFSLTAHMDRSKYWAMEERMLTGEGGPVGRAPASRRGGRWNTPRGRGDEGDVVVDDQFVLGKPCEPAGFRRSFLLDVLVAVRELRLWIRGVQGFREVRTSIHLRI